MSSCWHSNLDYKTWLGVFRQKLNSQERLLVFTSGIIELILQERAKNIVMTEPNCIDRIQRRKFLRGEGQET